MITMQQELDWEADMIDRGVQRYRAQQKKAGDSGLVENTSAGKRLLMNYIDQAAAVLDDYIKSATKRVPAAVLLKGLDADKIAFIAMKRMLTCLYTADCTVTSIAATIGQRVEDEYKFSILETEHKEYHDGILRSFKEKSTQNYEFKRKSLLASYRLRKGVVIESWGAQTKVAVGLICIKLVMQATDLFYVRVGNRSTGRKAMNVSKFLEPTPECVEWVESHDEAMELLFPDTMPMLVEPADWVAPDDGGYYSSQLRSITPFVITNKLNPNKRMSLYKKYDFSAMLHAVNWMQRTPWKINTEVLGIMREVWKNNLGIGMPRSEPYEFPPCPIEAGVKPEDLTDPDDIDDFKSWKHGMSSIYSAEAERVSKCLSISRSLKMAQDMSKYEEFYYVYRADFRGRVYAATTGLSPQGADQSKALLEFADGKALGKDGWYWFQVHGANKFGFDKEDYPNRVQWVEDHADDIRRVAVDPITNRWWGEADKPYQFLAWCIEYNKACEQADPTTFVSHIPVALDGSCNGLQHFSAMLRDEVGGAAVNLIPKATPADIYQEVADVLFGKLKQTAAIPGEETQGSRNWLALLDRENLSGIPRKLTKPPVMTLPYGSSQRAATGTTYDWYAENGNDFFGKASFRHAVYITPLLWTSISEVVIAARAAMAWIQKSAGKLSKEGKPLFYRTPLGFPVYQRNNQIVERMVKTNIDGGLRIRMQVETEKLDGRKQRQGSSPNFVHAIDATHMLMTVNKCAERGIRHFAMIHDDFGCHACDIPVMHEVIRDEFVKLHSRNLLQDFKIQHEFYFGVKLDPVPPMGKLDIHEVRNSPFFFG